ncbi:MAG: recombination mediator RecR [Candidatus Kapaibacteriales bacterium]
MLQAESLDKLVSYFSSLPSIGKKTATRLAFHVLRQPPEFAAMFGETLSSIHEKIKLCSKCNGFTETDPCVICSNEKRRKTELIVVEQPSDISIIEKTDEFNGQYHVLHGVLNPLEGIGVEDLKLRELVIRIGEQEIEEIIVALNPNVEGEVTTQYIAKLVKPIGIKVRKIASGIPIGHHLEFSDDATIARAIHYATEV